MDVYFQWLVAASAVCVLAGWLGLRAFRRAAAKREAERTQAEAIAWADAQRRAEEKVARHKARSEAAALEAARVAADEAARMEAAVVAAHEAAHAHALKLAAEEAERARRQAEAAHRAALLATQHAADEERARIARAEAELQSRREAERQAAALAPPAPAPAPPQPKPPEQTVVMVADDSKIVRVKTGRLLAQHRYQIVYATDGLEAVQQIEAGMPDVVITDVDMPGMDGFELTRHVRQNPLTAHIPVIMITAADDKHRADADRAGVSVLLGKPYPEEELIAHIRRAMNPAEAKAGALA
jgi:CheY-like chemotaxis protein